VRRRALAAAALERVSAFSADTQVGHVIALYTDLLAGGTPVPARRV
jgi:hypothetical protein